MRGVKAAVAMEMLKAAYLKHLPTVPHEFLMEPGAMRGRLAKDLLKVMREVLKAAGVDNEMIQRVANTGKLQGLIRRSFAEILTEMCRHVGFDVSADEIKLFVKCRDHLIHRGSFYCDSASPEESDRSDPEHRAREEYTFITEFLDRFFLRLLGYAGPYVDWRGTVKQIGPATTPLLPSVDSPT